MTAAHWLLLAAFAGFAVLWLWWTRRRPRVRASQTPTHDARLGHIAKIVDDHPRPCWLPGCPEGEVGALRDPDAITIDPKEQT